ncbi:MAG: hypothetical protein ABI181_06195, partial [Mycobacteriaceae bacterium]
MAPGVRTMGLGLDEVQRLVATVGRAPSLYNSQPWAVRLHADRIELLADRSRQLHATDPQGRHLRLAVGAALFNLTVALARLGIRPLVTLLPDRSDPDLLAVVRHGGTIPVSAQALSLSDAAARWATHRTAFTTARVTEQDRNALRRAALADGAWLGLIEDAEQQTVLAQLAVQARREQLGVPGVAAEVARWAASEPTGHDGGRPPLFGVLSAHQQGGAAEVRTGQALQRVLLTATGRGLVVSFISELVTVPEARERLRRCLHLTREPA